HPPRPLYDALPICVEAQNRSAKTIAEALQVDPRIARVLYPGLPTHPNHELATKQMHGYGGMLTIEIKADEATTSKVIERLELFRSEEHTSELQSRFRWGT